ncbi:hypothetical protein QQF64_026224 [Cirrhinus molitorella]|uniref:Gypsy retrotransposon integrase-like protein 1 n=1 Tax=Cirrhinus molitorella TaxID=172907 RepID=A0ABR3NR99_9TELE
MVHTKQRLRDLYWWPGMDCQVENAIKACSTCLQHDKMANTHVAPLCSVPTPTSAWEKLAIDVVRPLNNAPQGCCFAMTLIYSYSKWPEIAFAPDVHSATVVKFLSTVFS